MSDPSLAAATSACPGSRTLEGTPAERRPTLLCLVNFARVAAGLPALRESRALATVARAKARDVVVCGHFDHEACGKPAFAHMASSGFGYRLVAENLFLSQRPIGSAYDAFVAWLRSPPHRKVMFRSSFSHAGTAVFELDQFSGTPGVELWVLELGQKA